MTSASKLLILLGLVLAGALSVYLWMGWASDGPVAGVPTPGFEATEERPASLHPVDESVDPIETAFVSQERQSVEVSPASPPEEPTGSLLRGLVLEHDGERAKTFRVYAKAADRKKRKDLSGEFVDEDGRFELRGFQEGRYLVAAFRDSIRTSVVEVDMPRAEELLLQLPQPGWMSGVVVDADGVAIQGASVRILGPSQSKVTCGSAGQFTSGDLRAGNYEIVAEAEGWLTDTTVSTKAEVVAGRRTAGVQVRLVRGGTVTGVVLDGEGQPDPGVSVGISSRGAGSGLQLDETEANEAGEFVFTGVPAGFHLLKVENDDNRDGPLRLGKVEVVAGQTHHVVLGGAPESPVRLRGQVVYADGKPVADAELVTLAEGEGLLENANEARLDDDGRFEVMLTQPGPLVFLVRRSRFLVDIPAVDYHEVLLRLPGARITGRVTTKHGKPKRTRVRFTRLGTLGVIDIGTDADERTDQDGTFVFEGLVPGTYQVRGSATDVVEVDLADGQTAHVELTEYGEGKIRGRVVDAEGNPVMAVAVLAHDAEGRWVSATPSWNTVENGEFVIDELAPGAYTVCARGRNQASAESEPVVVRESEFSEVVLQLASATHVTLVLLDAEGVAVSASFRILDADGREQIGAFSSIDAERLLRDGFSTSRPVVGPLPPGRYRVIANASDGRSAEGKLILRGEAERVMELKLP